MIAEKIEKIYATSTEKVIAITDFLIHLKKVISMQLWDIQEVVNQLF